MPPGSCWGPTLVSDPTPPQRLMAEYFDGFAAGVVLAAHGYPNGHPDG